MNYDAWLVFWAYTDPQMEVSGGVDPTLVVEVLTPLVDAAPGGIIVAVAGAQADLDVEFLIDGFAVHTEPADSNGGVEPITIPIPDLRDVNDDPIFGRGPHTLTVEQAGSVSTSVSFEIDRDPHQGPRFIEPDEPPVAVPSRITPTVHRWVLQDLMPGGLGTWVMPMNPEEWDGPPFERNLTAQATTAPVGGQYHVYESVLLPVERTFSGYCPTAAMREKLEDYGDLNRRFYLFDHRDRVWIVTFSNVELVPRLVENWNGTVTAEGHDYTVTAVIYSREPLEAP